MPENIAGQLISYKDYWLTRKIATGGMAELFRARKVGEAGFEKWLVIKRLLPHLTSDPEFLSMFLDEAKLASQLNNQNIVQVYELGKVDNSPDDGLGSELTYFIAMEYVSGRNLAQVLLRGRKKNKPLSSIETVMIIHNAALGLDYAHTKKSDRNEPLNIVHRDVSPHNILISYEGEVKLTDFGIAKALSQSQVTQPGVLKGKLAYMSPEQGRGGDIDPRSDIYSLGIVLWEAITGRRLFKGSSEAGLLGQVLKPVINPPSTYNSDISPELEAICLKCLAPQVDDRYSDARELVSEIENYLQNTGVLPRAYALKQTMSELFKEEIEQEWREIEEELEAVGRMISAKEVPNKVPLKEEDDIDDATMVVAGREEFPGSSTTNAGVADIKKLPWGIISSVAISIVLIIAGFLILQPGESPRERAAVNSPTSTAQTQISPTIATTAPTTAVSPETTANPPAVLPVATADPLTPLELSGLDSTKTIYNSLGLPLVKLPPGLYYRGSPEGKDSKIESPRRMIRISENFYIGAVEINQGQWVKVMGSNPSVFKNPLNPVENVSWAQVNEFIKRLNKIEKTDSYRLPTEAEWEYACRAEVGTDWFFGQNPLSATSYAWLKANGDGKTHPVGMLSPNKWGLRDTCGNVAEWCADWFGFDYYASGPTTDPSGPDTGSERIIRGGSWDSQPDEARSASRAHRPPNFKSSKVGFRIVKSAVK